MLPIGLTFQARWRTRTTGKHRPAVLKWPSKWTAHIMSEQSFVRPERSRLAGAVNDAPPPSSAPETYTTSASPDGIPSRTQRGSSLCVQIWGGIRCPPAKRFYSRWYSAALLRLRFFAARRFIMSEFNCWSTVDHFKVSVWLASVEDDQTLLRSKTVGCTIESYVWPSGETSRWSSCRGIFKTAKHQT